MAQFSRTGLVQTLLQRTSDEVRFVDIALQLTVWTRKGGILKQCGASEVFGGVWDVWQQRYREERKAQQVYMVKVSKKQMRFINKALSKDKRRILAHPGRGFDKSHVLAILFLIFAIIYPGESGMLVSPTFDKSQVMWDKLLLKLPTKELMLPGRDGEQVAKRRLIFLTGYRLKFASADKSSSLRGWGVSHLGFDERQDISQRSVDAALYSCREVEDYKVAQIGTPDMGSDFHDEYLRYKKSKIAYVQGGESYDNPFIPHTVFRDSEGEVDADFYAQEVEGKWVKLGGTVYSRFDADENIRAYISAPHRDITRAVLADRYGIACDYAVGLDYGSEPMVAVVCKLIGSSDWKESGYTIHVIDEVVIQQDADADQMALRLIESDYADNEGRYESGERTRNALIFDDASGQYSKGGRSSAAYLAARGFVAIHKSKNPPVRDRVASLKAKICTTSGKRSLLVSPKCKLLIRSLKNQAKDRKGQPDKTDGLDHANDALGYLVHSLCPVDRWADHAKKEDLAA